MITWALARAAAPYVLGAALLAFAWAALDKWGDRKFEAGAASVQTAWDQEKADARVALAVRIGFADATGKRTAEQAATITQETRAETTAALGRIEDAIAGFEADLRKRGCPVDVPPGVRDEGRKAVAAARAAGNEVRSDNAAR